MSRFVKSFFLLCGLILTLAAFPVLGQENSNGIEINKKPLKDLAESVKVKKIDWAKPFRVELEGSLTKEGKFDQKKTKITKSEGDAELAEVVKQAFAAVSDSGWLGYLRNQGIEKIKISSAQNSETFSVSVISQLPTPERANTISSGLNSLVNIVLMLDKNGTKKLGDDEKKLLSSTRTTVQEKTVNINVSLSANDFQEMLKRQISGLKEKTEAK